MRNARYKYFSRREHAEQFVSGSVFHRTLGYFRDFENAAGSQVVGDEYESVRLYRPATGLAINDLTHGRSFNLDSGFKSSAYAGEISIFCMSYDLNDSLIAEFNAAAYVEVFKPSSFENRWRRALPRGAARFARRVTYYRPDDLPAENWALPDRIATSKVNRFEYQREYRLGFSVTGALDLGVTEQVIRKRFARPLPRPEEHHHWVINVGDLSDICRLTML